MCDYSVQFFCGLHAKWNVRDKKCSNGHIFGKKASEAWSRRMQYAEGPKAFALGYEKMKNEFNDPSHVEYIEELYTDESKAYFKQDMNFSNAVLVDVCEILFSAVTRWVSGSSRTACSLLMAVVRITEGSRSLIVRPFLKSPTKTITKMFRKSHNYDVSGMFKFFSTYLTQWSVLRMYKLLDLNWTKYTSMYVQSNDTMVVYHKYVNTVHSPYTPHLLLMYSSYTPHLLLTYSSYTPLVFLMYRYFGKVNRPTGIPESDTVTFSFHELGINMLLYLFR